MSRKRLLIFVLANLIVQTIGWGKPPVMRRLYLEHPDLMPYPLFIEHYC